jgi:hypothetical protein
MPNLAGVTTLGAQLGLQPLPENTSDRRAVRVVLADLLAISVAMVLQPEGSAVCSSVPVPSEAADNLFILILRLARVLFILV